MGEVSDFEAYRKRRASSLQSDAESFLTDAQSIVDDFEPASPKQGEVLGEILDDPDRSAGLADASMAAQLMRLAQNLRHPGS